MKQKIKTYPIVRFNFQMFDLASNSVYLYSIIILFILILKPCLG